MDKSIDPILGMQIHRETRFFQDAEPVIAASNLTIERCWRCNPWIRLTRTYHRRQPLFCHVPDIHFGSAEEEFDSTRFVT